VACLGDGVGPTMDLVSRCSDTLESLSISYYALGVFPSTSVIGQYLTATRRHRQIWNSFT
jgi:hypothetical protein